MPSSHLKREYEPMVTAFDVFPAGWSNGDAMVKAVDRARMRQRRRIRRRERRTKRRAAFWQRDAERARVWWAKQGCGPDGRRA